MKLAALLVTAAAALAAAAPAAPARFAVGVAPGADAAALRAELERRTGGPVESLAPVAAFVVDAEPAQLRGLRAAYVERLTERRLAAYVPTDPFVARQWYLTHNRAYDAWEARPPLPPVRVAVIDSGADLDHPELVGRIAGAESFVGGTPADRQGHGTFVAGLIAAGVDNGIGIAGLAPGAELLVAKVVTGERTIPVEAEARAIRWAVANGARVINMSLGGLRDPLDPSRDTFSPLEASAVAYAVRKGVVVVAAVGNGDQAPTLPWRFASYPAALPHVLGVGALTRSGDSPPYSNRDAIYVDVAAPGEDILSTLPRGVTAPFTACAEQGYSSCGPGEFRSAEGTSFAAPQVSAAAANLIGTRPDLAPEQVVALLERTAVDASAASGCRRCPLLRDRYTGWGRLDATAAIQALQGQVPAEDALEPNDDAGTAAYPLFFRGRHRRVDATLDYWDDQNDVYSVALRRGERLFASLEGPPRTDLNLVLWRPAARRVDDLRAQNLRVRQSARPGANEYLGFRAPAAGRYFVQVKIASAGAGRYRLLLAKPRLRR